MKLIIVESPTKAKTIKKFLPDYQVIASVGHIRDLPKNASEVPTSHKKLPWASLGIDVEHDFKPLYVINPAKKKLLKEISLLVRGATDIYLATDEDREGESISWHLKEALATNKTMRRLVFHEITKSAITNALANYRDIDYNLVHAQEARRVLDRLVGYTISPLLWKKIAPGLSAGRVQSVVIKFIVEREIERINFVVSNYSSLEFEFAKNKHEFKANLVSLGSKQIAISKDFDSTSGKLIDSNKYLSLTPAAAQKIQEKFKGAEFNVDSITAKKTRRNPPLPFITSSLQQEAIRKLRISSREVMSLAQSLYEKGFITYMRTDSTTIASEAITGMQKFIQAEYGAEYLNSEGTRSSVASKNAQEAHEAIRPAGETFKLPAKSGLKGLELGLYSIIWKRTIASQMMPAIVNQVTLDLSSDDAILRAYGQKIEFLGFWKVYEQDDSDFVDNKDVILPNLKENEKLKSTKINLNNHTTEPKARFNEASIVKLMEAEGIGRPSTYSAVLETIVSRGYVFKKGNVLVPTLVAFAVKNLLDDNLPSYVDAGFTAEMEGQLDKIAQGKLEHVNYLKQVYSGKNGLKSKVSDLEANIDGRAYRSIKLPQLETSINIGRFGPYIMMESDKETLSVKIPIDLAPADLTKEMLVEEAKKSKKITKIIGVDPVSGEKIYFLIGPFGPYLQIGGETGTKDKKPKRISLPKTTDFNQINMELVVKLLKLPQTLGKHPKTGATLQINIGPFGPYVLHNLEKKDYRSIPDLTKLFSLTLEEAVEIVDAEKTRSSASALRVIGKHPSDGASIGLYKGRYGHYIKWNKINASLKSETDIDKIDLNQAIELLNRKAISPKATRKFKAKAK